MNTKRTRAILEPPPNGWEKITFAIGIALLWAGVTSLGVISQLLLPSPMSVAQAAMNIGPVLAWHAFATTTRALVGLFIGTASGILCGLAVRYTRAATLAIEPGLDASRPVPAIALLPFFILIFGFSELGRVVLVAVSVAIILAAGTVEAVETIPEPWFRFPLVCGFSRAKIFLKVVIPALAPLLRGPIRIALALSFTLVIASEFMGAQQGLGYLINVARVNLATQTILLCVLILGVIAQVIDLALTFVIGRLGFWYRGARSALEG